MRILLGAIFVLCLIVIGINMIGCAGALSTGNILNTIEMAIEIGEKVKELHDAGLDKKILDDVNRIVADAHDAISILHDTHVKE